MWQARQTGGWGWGDGAEAIRALLAKKIKRERGRKLLSALNGEVTRLSAVIATAAAAAG